VDILKGIDIEVESGRVPHPGRPLGLRQVHAAQHHRRAGRAHRGRIHIGGATSRRCPGKDRDIAMVFQSYALYPNMNVAQNIAFGLEMRKVPKAERDSACSAWPPCCRSSTCWTASPAQLSGGQRQRVAMGRALARDPQLFLFDEPLSNLDAKLRVEMRAEIKRCTRRTRTTTVYVTHDQVEAMTLGDRIAVMKDGVVQQLGTPDEIYSRPATRFVAEFIGSPAMNRPPGNRGRSARCRRRQAQGRRRHGAGRHTGTGERQLRSRHRRDNPAGAPCAGHATGPRGASRFDARVRGGGGRQVHGRDFRLHRR
jgi:multiple sugar transport system ATP-binding protein